MRSSTTAGMLAVAALLLAACSAPAPTGSGASTAPSSSSSSASPSASISDLDLYAGTEPAVAPRGAVTTRTIRTPDGLTRSYRLFVPSGGRGVAPLLVALHGGLGSGAQFETNSGFDGLATSNTFLVAYPDGVGRAADGSGGARTWNGGDCCGPAASRKVDDVAFLTLLVADVAKAYAVDPNRVYAAGHSNGGIMALRLACEASDVFAAVGVQSSALEIAMCDPREPVSLMQIHGTADTNVPLAGGRGSGLAGVAFTPPKQAATTLAAADRCTAGPSTTTDSTNPDLQLTAWSSCAAATSVRFLAVTGAAHAWMGHPPSSPLARTLVGAPYPDLDSSRAIWSFLAAHPRS